MQQQYRRDRGAVPAGHVELDVQVLTSGYWPRMDEAPCALPPEVQAAADAFAGYYLGRHSGRKLTWVPGKGTAELRAVFPNGKVHELVVSTYQMAMLLAFNGGGGAALSYTQLRAAVGGATDEAEFRRHLLSLCAPKTRVLVRSGKSKDIEPSETFGVNAEFDSKLVKVRVPLLSAKNFLPGGGGAGTGGGAGWGAGGERDLSDEVLEVSSRMGRGGRGGGGGW